MMLAAVVAEACLLIMDEEALVGGERWKGAQTEEKGGELLRMGGEECK